MTPLCRSQPPGGENQSQVLPPEQRKTSFDPLKETETEI